jgi:hypothetical protein
MLHYVNITRAVQKASYVLKLRFWRATAGIPSMRAITATSNEGRGEGELATPWQMISAARHSAVVAWGIVHTRLYLRWVNELLIIRWTTTIVTDSDAQDLGCIPKQLKLSVDI